MSKLMKSLGGSLMPPPMPPAAPATPTLPPVRTFRVRHYEEGNLLTTDIHAHMLDVDVSGTLSFMRYQQHVDGTVSPFYPKLINRDQWLDCEEVTVITEPSRLVS